MQQVRICLVDTNAITRKGIEALLGQSHLSIGGMEALENIGELEDVLNHKCFDILLLDDARLVLTDLAGVISRLLHLSPALKIIVLSTKLSVTRVQRIIQSGALGFIYKDDDMEHAIISSVNTVNRNLVYHSPRVSELLSMNNYLASLNNLKTQDFQVLRLMEHGRTVQQIALEMGISGRSVYRSRTKLREALDVPTNEMIIDAAREQGLLEDENMALPMTGKFHPQ